MLLVVVLSVLVLQGAGDRQRRWPRQLDNNQVVKREIATYAQRPDMTTTVNTEANTDPDESETTPDAEVTDEVEVTDGSEITDGAEVTEGADNTDPKSKVTKSVKETIDVTYPQPQMQTENEINEEKVTTEVSWESTTDSYPAAVTKAGAKSKTTGFGEKEVGSTRTKSSRSPSPAIDDASTTDGGGQYSSTEELDGKSSKQVDPADSSTYDPGETGISTAAQQSSDLEHPTTAYELGDSTYEAKTTSDEDSAVSTVSDNSGYASKVTADDRQTEPGGAESTEPDTTAPSGEKVVTTSYELYTEE